MKLGEVVRALSLEVRTGEEELDVEVTGGYACDLLSYVMANAREGHIWVTVQSHPNIVAVASLLSLSAIVVAEGGMPSSATLEKAAQEQVTILTTKDSAFTVAGRLYELGVTGAE